MPKKKSVSVAGLTKLSSDYSATLENTPPPSPSPSPPPEDKEKNVLLKIKLNILHISTKRIMRHVISNQV